MACFQFRFVTGTLAVSLACSAMGAGLGDLKKDTEQKAAAQQPKPEPPKETYSYSTDAATSSFGSGTYPTDSSGGSGFMGDFLGWLAVGAFRSFSDSSESSSLVEEEGWAEQGALHTPRHEWGQAVMPYIRTDLNWQYIDSDNEAIDGRIELGYKAIGFQARATKYDDSLADLSQRINQYYGVLRFGGRWPEMVPGAFEIALGLGVAQHNGDLSDDSSVAITLPLKYHPADWLGFEFRPAWYESDYSGIVYNMGDYDLSASLGWHYLQVRGGYRWIWYNGSSNGYYNNGFYIGLSASF